MTPEEILARARSMIGIPCIYKLGKGGFDPTLTQPWKKIPACDCSGFVCWCIGEPRSNPSPWYKPYGGWINTDSIHRDALTPFGLFTRVFPGNAEPGHIIVYPRQSEGSYGHVGILSAPDKVIHCSSGNYRLSAQISTSPSAIMETSLAVFLAHDAITCIYAHA